MTKLEQLGRYELLREIGSGGMAVVYLARVLGEGGFERLVAVKKLHDQMARDPDFVDMFLDEARLAARIRHPNVVATTDVQRTDEALFLVMEYVEGLALSALLRTLRHKKRKLPIPVAIRIMLDTLSGLHAAHELRGPDGSKMQLVHRDVSPQNVLVGRDGVSRITDFGVARAEARLSSTQGGQLKGKLPYMPPEQIGAEEIDRRTDIYAAGLVLWEMLVGHRTFKANNQGALMHKIMSGVRESPRQHNVGVPPAVDEVCMRALALTPNERWQSAADFADALEEAARGSAIRIANARAIESFVAEQMPEGEAIPPPATSGSGLVTPPSLRSASMPSAVATPSVRTATSFETAERGGRTGVVAGALVALMLGGVGAWYFVMQAPGNAESTPAAASSAEPQAPPSSVPDDDAAEVSANAEATAEVSASAEATAEVSASAEASAPPRPFRPRPQPRPSPKPKPAPNTKSTSAADFLPPEL